MFKHIEKAKSTIIAIEQIRRVPLVGFSLNHPLLNDVVLTFLKRIRSLEYINRGYNSNKEDKNTQGTTEGYTDFLMDVFLS